MGLDFGGNIDEAKENDESDSNSDSEAPTPGDTLPPSGFRRACEEYAEWAVDHYDEFGEVTLDTVTVQVSQKLKRAAGKAGTGRSNVPTKWYMRFAYGAYEKWGWGEEVEATIRHELVHIKQYQETGSGGHGVDFKIMADNVDAPRHCKQFTEHNYGIYCSDCDEKVAGRIRKCKMTKKPGRYHSNCCNAECYSEKL